MNNSEIKSIFGSDAIAKTSPCDICSFGCPVRSFIKDGRIVGVEPDRESPVGRGFLCAKGYASRQYVYRSDRIKTPLRRTGKRGEGEFEAISWETALSEIADKLNKYKAQFGADSVAFFSGYTKWYRPYLHRLAHSFGTLNYGTESSSCFQATVVANKCSSGCMTSPDVMNAGVVIGWGYNTYYSNLPMPNLEPAKAKGAKIIIVDPKQTPAVMRVADVHLQIKPGTDGALAMGIARELIHRGAVDMDFVRNNVTGFEQYAEYVERFTPEQVNIITEIPVETYLKAVDIIINNLPLCMIEGNAGMIHHKNGVQNFRAVNALMALTGAYVKVGGNKPFKAQDPAAFTVLNEEKFVDDVRPKDAKPKIGSDKYPLWSECIDEYQAMELAGQIMTGEPYPIKALFALGMNARLFPDSGSMFKALETIDFFACADIFMSDTAKYADIVLPACTSFERGELRASGRRLVYYKNAVDPLFESRSDTDIVCDLAKALGLEDELLTSGYDACCRSMLEPLGVDLDELKEKGVIKLPDLPSSGELKFYTSSGKYELHSSLAEKHGYEPLPKYYDPYDDADPNEFPLILCSGGRLPNAFASRFHDVPWARQLRSDAMVDINFKTASELSIKQGDIISLSTSVGSLEAKANLTNLNRENMVTLYHGYSEADVNSIVPGGHNDPFSGFPGYRSIRCKVELVAKSQQDKKAISVGAACGAFSFNSTNCTGCGACVVACMDRNTTDLSYQKPLREVWERRNSDALHFDMNFCVHCDEPACLNACKFGAVSRNELGMVVMESEKCVNCGACVKSCPYGAVRKAEKPYKCDGCMDRVSLGLKPVCIDACRFGALDMKVTNTAAVVLAGGKSSRMGTDKSRLKIGESTFSEKLISDFAQHFKNVYLSVAPGSDLEGPNIIRDEKSGLGPLSGILAAMKNTKGDNVFICATDMPFADPKLAVRLVSMLDGHDACLIRMPDGKVETAFGVFSKRALPAVQDELDTGKRSIMGLLQRINVKLIEVDKLGDISDSVFMNINTPEDYDKL